LLPLVKERWQAADLRRKLARAGTLVVLERLRDLAAAGVVALGTVLLLIWTLTWLSAGSLGAPKAVIDSLASVYRLLKGAAESYGVALGVLSLVGASLALYLVARHARKRVSQAWMAKAEEVYARLGEDPATLERARQDPELRPILDHLDGLVGRLAAHQHGVDGATLAPNELDYVRRSLSHTLSVLAIEMARKETMFADAARAPAGGDGSALTGWQRVARVLASDRFCKDLGLLKKPLSRVVSALMFVSLLGWSAAPLADSLRLTVNNLRVNVLAHDTQRALDQALSTAGELPRALPDRGTDASEPPVSPSAQTTARLLARAAVLEVERSVILDRLVGRTRDAHGETEFVRAAITNQHMAAPERADEAAQVRREVAESVRRPTDGAPAHGLGRHLEGEFLPHVERFQRENPTRYAQWAARIEQRYSAVQSPLDAQSKLIGRILDEAFGAVSAHPATEIGRQAEKLIKDFGKEAVRSWADTTAKAWFTGTIVDLSRPHVLAEAAGRFAFESSAECRRFVENLVAAEGRGWAASPPAQHEAEMTHKVATKVAALHRGTDEAQQALIERLSGYDRLFPSTTLSTSPEDPMPPRIPGGGVSADGGGLGGIPGGGDGGGRAGRISRGSGGGGAGAVERLGGGGFARSRATSFRLAARSFRVRGVLIGQDSEAHGLDVSDIRWTVAAGARGSRVALEVKADGSWRELGPYDAAVVNQALRYAADGRVVATTITAGDGVAIRRITYLHPVLVDTPLGCRIVEADRFIDTFTHKSSREKPAPPVALLANDRQNVYQWMALVALAENVAALPRDARCPREEINRRIADLKITAVRFSADLWQAIDAFMAAEEKKLPGSTRLLREAHSCALGKPAHIAPCLCDNVKPAGLPERYWFPEDHTSQLRERTPDIKSDWAWMQRSPDRLGMLDLWIHTTFALRRGSAPTAGGDETTAIPVDFPPADIQTLRGAVAERLPIYLRQKLRSPSYDDFMTPLEDFVLLQRLFRAALAGTLGRAFPLSRLVALERETREYVPAQPTIRWEVDRPEARAFLREADAKAREAYDRWEQDTLRRGLVGAARCDRVTK
jgi:hypothetical protein